MTYFVRVNGKTLHNNPKRPELYVPGEPPKYPVTYFNAFNYCLRNNIVRIGWPGTGDLSKARKTGPLSHSYNASEFKPHHEEYLRAFAQVEESSTVVMPDKDNPGDVYLGRVTQTYHYFHDVPVAPHEHAHRLGVNWVRDENDKPIRFFAHEFGINIHGGFWMRAFHALDESPTGRAAIPKIALKMKELACPNL